MRDFVELSNHTHRNLKGEWNDYSKFRKNLYNDLDNRSRSPLRRFDWSRIFACLFVFSILIFLSLVIVSLVGETEVEMNSMSLSRIQNFISGAVSAPFQPQIIMDEEILSESEQPVIEPEQPVIEEPHQSEQQIVEEPPQPIIGEILQPLIYPEETVMGTSDLSILAVNAPPTLSAPVINSTTGVNTTTENITCYPQDLADTDGDAVWPIFNWYVNGTPIAVANMPFDINDSSEALDYSGYFNDGTLNGDVTWNESGKLGGAYHFDGDGDFISIGDIYTSKITVESWIYLDSNTVDGRIVSKDNPGASSTREWLLGAFMGVSDRFEFTIFDGDDLYTNAIWSTTPNVGQWYHVIGTFNGTKTHIYVDGVLRGTSSATANGVINDGTAINIEVGRRQDGFEYFDGLIDGVVIYNRSLRGDEIYQRYVEGLGVLNTSTIVSDETGVGENWTCEVYATDLKNESDSSYNSSLTVLEVSTANNPPTLSAPVINSTTGVNTTTENLTCYPQDLADIDGDDVWPIFNWYLDDESFAVLNMPLDTNISGESLDFSGYFNDGNVTGATWVESGKLGGAYDFDGTDDHINVGNDSSLASNRDTTIEAWIYRTVGNTDKAVVSKSYSNEFDFFILSGGELKLHHGEGDAGWEDGLVSSGALLNSKLNQWVHVAFVRGTSPKEIRFYVNGAFLNSQSYNDEVSISHYDVHIGSRADAGPYFDGMIDGVKIYNHSLSDGQIYQSYVEGLGVLNTSTIVSNETILGDIWKCEAYATDLKNESEDSYNSSLTILSFEVVNPLVFDPYPQIGQVFNTSQEINITINATDAGGGVDAVLLNITHPDLTTITQIGMSLDPSDGESQRYNASFTIPSTGGIYNLTFIVNDTYNNVNDTTISSFSAVNSPPTQSVPVLNSTTGTNYTTENITCYPQDLADVDGDGVWPVFNWYKNNVPITVLNMPFDINDSSETLDFSGHFNDGTLNEDVTWSETGKIGGAYELGGTSGNISTPLNMAEMGINFSISLWFYADTGQTGYERVFSAEQGGAQSGPYLATAPSSKMRFCMQPSGASPADFYYATERWNHFVGVYNGTNLIAYLNGTEVNSTSQVVDWRETTQMFTLGINAYGPDNVFGGKVDEVKVFNSSLSREQVYQLYVEGFNVVNTSTIVSDETTIGENWSCEVYATDLKNESEPLNSSLTIFDDYINLTNSYSWVNLTDDDSPLGRYGSSMVYDSLNNVFVLFGGYVSTGAAVNETWIYNLSSNTWEQKYPDTSPSERTEHAMAFDSWNNVTILYGGNVNSLHDTWVYNYSSNNWTNMAPLVTPTITSHGDLSFDSVNGVSIMFGGLDSGYTRSAETWVYNYSSNTWTNKNPSSPPTARYNHDTSFDSESGVLILYGGDIGSETDIDDTWAYDFSANTWTNMAPSSNPGTMRWDELSFDSSNHVSILFGGADVNAGFNITWVYDYSDNEWTQLYITDRPPARAHFTQAFDSDNDALVIFGGVGTWGVQDYRVGTWMLNSSFVNITEHPLNYVPTLSAPIINSTTGTNYTTENITCYPQDLADGDGDAVWPIFNWYVNGTPIAVVNMPFDLNDSAEALDFSGQANDGTLNGDVTWNESGKLGGAYHFDGAGDYITIGDIYTKIISVEAWVYFDSNTVDGRIASKDDPGASSTREWLLGAFMGASDRFEFSIFDGEDSYTNAVWSTTPNVGQWYHVIGTFNGTKTHIYVDGVLRGTSSATANGVINDGVSINIEVGRRQDGFEYFDGLIDDVVIYNRSLSGAEVYQRYVEGSGVLNISTIVSDETGVGENWTCEVYATDLKNESASSYNSSLTVLEVFVGNNLPTLSSPVINSTTGGNFSSENITCYPQDLADTDGDDVLPVFNWYKNNVPVAILNMPFETNFTASDNSTAGVLDFSGYGNDGRLGNSTEGPQPVWTSGQFGGAYDFDGVDDYINVGNDGSLASTGNTTIEAWVYRTVGNTDKAVVSKHYAYEYDFFILSGGELKLHHDDGSWSDSGIVSSGADLNSKLNQWVHIAFVRTLSPKEVKFYVDGAFLNTQEYTDNVVASSYGVHIGSRPTGGPFFDGKIDGVKIYNISLSDEQIYQSYAEAFGVLNTSTIVSDETAAGENWSCEVYATDFEDESAPLNSSLEILSLDVTNPEVFDPYPQIGQVLNTSRRVNITINATDAGVGVDAVIVNVTYPDLTTVIQFVMSLDPSDGESQRYNFSFLIPSVEGIYNLTFIVNDIYSNVNDTTISSFNATNANPPPTQSAPVINSTTGTNSTVENITCYPQNLADAESEDVFPIFNWYMNNIPIAVLNMPFDLDGTLETLDFSGYDNDGSVSGAVWNSSGKVGGAYTFDGIDDFINISNSGSLNITRDITIEAWIFRNSGNAYQTIVSKHNNYDYDLIITSDIDSDPGELKFHHGDGAGENTLESEEADMDGKIGRWIHVAVVRDADSSKITYYLNGTFLSSAGYTTTPISSSGPVYIGSRLGGSFFFNGSIDGVKIYNRSLSADQIYQSYIEGFNVLNTSTVTANGTEVGENWTCEITPTDLTSEGEPLNSSLEILLHLLDCENLTDHNDEYILNQDLTSSGTCFIVEGDNVTLDCDGYSLTGDDTGYGVNATNVKNFTLKDCRIVDYYDGVYFEGTTISNLINVTSTSNDHYGIYLGGSSNTNNLYNVTSTSNSYSGIVLDSCQYNSVVEGDFHSNTQYGIYVYSSQLNNFTDVDSNSNSQYGIYVQSADSNRFVDTSFSGNAVRGVNIRQSSFNYFNGTEIETPNVVYLQTEISGTGNNFTDTTFVKVNGTVRFPGSFEVTHSKVVNQLNLNISHNFVFLNNTNGDSTNISFLNISAEITLHNLEFTNPKIQFALDDSTFNDCIVSTDPACDEVSYNGSTQVFNVTHFTAYRTQESALPEVFDPLPSAGATWNVSTAMEIAINATSALDISAVIANITWDDGGLQEQILVLVNETAGEDKYNNSFTPSVLTTYTVNFTANDTSNNINATESTYFTVVEVVNPAVFDPYPQIGQVFNTSSQINITINSTDAGGGVDVVLLNITHPDLTTITQIVMSLDSSDGEGQRYNATFTIPSADGTYNLTFIVNDTYSNVNDTTISSFSAVTINNPPTQSVPILNSTTENNLTTENITCHPQDLADVDGDGVWPIFNWYVDNDPIMLLNMPFDLNDSVEALDYSSYANDGSIGGGTAAYKPVWNVSEKFGGVYNFDGFDDYIFVGDSDSLSVPRNFTLEAWVKPMQNKEIAQEVLGKNTEYRIILDSVERIRFILDQAIIVSPVEKVTIGEWSHIVAIYNDSTAKVYINGSLVHEEVEAPTLSNTGTDLHIGRYYTGGTPFNGSIGDVKIYERALSDEEVYQKYTEGWEVLNTSTFVSEETLDDENWTCEVYATDLKNESVSSYTSNLTVVELNYAPEIEHIVVPETVSPVEANISQVRINFTIFDDNGYDDIDLSTFKLNFTHGSEHIRQNNSCTAVINSGTESNFSCLVDMWYFDEAGEWNVSIYVEDHEGVNASNLSVTFSYQPLTAFVISPNLLSWEGLEVGGTNELPSDSTLLNNTGNVEIGNVSVKGLNLEGSVRSDVIIAVENFTVSVNSGAGACIGDNLSDGAEVNVTGSVLDSGNLSEGGGVAQEELFYCMPEVPSGLTKQTYSTPVGTVWEIRIIALLAVMTFGKRKRRKLSKKEEVIVKELELLKSRYDVGIQELLSLIKHEEGVVIPVAVFDVKIMGPAESLVKYMRESLGLKLSEIANMLNRDSRTVWATYKHAKDKKERLVIKGEKMFVPITVFGDRRLSILENVVKYLGEQGMSNLDIAKMIGKDQRNIGTLKVRIKNKLGVKRK